MKHRHPRVADHVLAKLPNLYARCAAHFGPALDLAEVIRRYTQASRVRFASGAAASGHFGCDELDAIVHAGELGYELCFRRTGMGTDYYCWLPWGHAGECVKDNFFLWRLLFGQPFSEVPVIDSGRERTEPEPREQYRLRGLGERPIPGAS